MRGKKIDIKELVKLFFYGNGLMLKTSNSKYFLLIGLSILGGIVSPINAILWEKFLNWLIEVLGSEIIIDGMGWYYLIMLSTVPLLGYILDFLLQYIKQTFSDQMNLFITDRVLEKSFKLSMESYDESSTYNNIKIAITHTTQNCMGLLDAITELLFYGVQIVSFIFILVSFNWKIIILAIFGAVPSLYVALRANKHWFDTLNIRMGKLRHIDYLKSLLVRNEYIKETKLYNMGNKVLGYIKDCFDRFMLEDKNARKHILEKKTWARFFDEVLTLVIKVWILMDSLRKKSAVGLVVLYFNSNESLKNSLIVLLSELAKLHENILYLQILKGIDDIKVECVPSNKKMDLPFRKIEFRNVSFSYPGQNRQALKNVSFVFERGKTYSIVGFNGAGKTTLLKLLLGLYEPERGEILIDGVNLNQINKTDYYLRIGAVFQDFIKYPFTIEENISTSLNGSDEDSIFEAVKFAYLEDMVRKLPEGIKTVLMREWNNGIDVSQGQWQKIAIARCYYRKPDIMILDEPFSSIDIEAENCIMKNIKQMSEEKMNIFITHHFSSISMADIVIVLDDGDVIEQGTHNELIEKKGKYFQLYSEQLENLNKIYEYKEGR